MGNKTESGPPNDGSVPSTRSCNLEPERLAAFIDGRLSDDEAAAIEEHLATCEACRWVAGRAALLAAENDRAE